jgi:hydrogenase nickel incorporation protein HypB
VAVVTKNELADVVEFDWNAARTNIQSVRPGMQIFRLSAKTGEGMEEYLKFLGQQLAEQRAVAQI